MHCHVQLTSKEFTVNQQIVVRREEKLRREEKEEKEPVEGRRRPLLPNEEGREGLERREKERLVKSENGRYWEKNDWAKNGPPSRSYQLTRFASKTHKPIFSHKNCFSSSDFLRYIYYNITIKTYFEL